MSPRAAGRAAARGPSRPGRCTCSLVDDSAVVRQVLTGLLGQEPGLTAEAAADPLIALDKIRHHRPDVIVLDLEMPRMDGLTFLRRLMAEDPIPTVVCSGLAGAGTEAALRAIEEGAVEVIAKPRLAVRDFLHESAVLLIDAVRGARPWPACAGACRGPRRRPAWTRARCCRPGARPCG